MLAHQQVLGVDLGELVHVDAADHVAQRLLEREHRQLHEIERVADQRVEHRDLVRMDEVLGVVQHDAGKALAQLHLEIEDADAGSR